MNSRFLQDDVTLLLKDITELVTPLPSSEREKRIQAGTHYSEMLPLEYRPSADYIRIYEESLNLFGQSVADAVARLSDRIIARKGSNAVIVSLARAGTPIGVLIRRYIRMKYGLDCPHYSVSIIRDRGMDRNAMAYILNRHHPSDIQFVDGWTGKGVIYRELRKEISAFPGVSDDLGVVADPAWLTDLCGTHEDIMIPSSCLNCTVCGLISRTFLRSDIIGENDYHGAAYYSELAAEDRTYEFIDRIQSLFRINPPTIPEIKPGPESRDVDMLSRRYGISDLNFIKPGIGETTRVLLRRVPWKIIIDENHRASPELKHILQLAHERNTDIEYAVLTQYKCCGLIRQMSDV